MPICIPLVITSVLFVVPAVVARIHQKQRLAIETTILAATSVGFHSTRHPLWFHIDKLWAHFFGLRHLCVAIKRLWKYRRPVDITLFTAVVVSCLIYKNKSVGAEPPESTYWHMALHNITNSAITLYAVT